jgi:mono/diheme cytochrome c family protein
VKSFVLAVIGIVSILAAAMTIAWSRSDKGGSAAVSPASPLGKNIYTARCAMCHGSDGKGDGPYAALLSPRPRDFTGGKYKFRSTESGSLPTDADLERTTRFGLHGTTMPDLQDYISGDSLQAVVAYIKSFSGRFSTETQVIIQPANPPPVTAASVENGKKVYDKLQCYGCHGLDGAGRGAIATDLQDDWGNPVPATNLTEPWTFRAGSAPTDLYLRFRTGIDGTPMPSFKGSATDRELWDLANFVLSLGRKPVWSMNADEIASFYDSLERAEKQNPLEHGKLLVEIHGCADCHSPHADDGSMIASLRFAGGMQFNLGPYGTIVSTNLTSDKETGLGNWTDEEIRRALVAGVRKDGSRTIPFPMPWTSYASMSDADIAAITTYLRSVPPVHNKIPEPKPLNIFSYLWAKFNMLILKNDFAVTSPAGNAGSADAALTGGKTVQKEAQK